MPLLAHTKPCTKQIFFPCAPLGIHVIVCIHDHHMWFERQDCIKMIDVARKLESSRKSQNDQFECFFDALGALLRISPSRTCLLSQVLQDTGVHMVIRHRRFLPTPLPPHCTRLLLDPHSSRFIDYNMRCCSNKYHVIVDE